MGNYVSRKERKCKGLQIKCSDRPSFGGKFRWSLYLDKPVFVSFFATTVWQSQRFCPDWLWGDGLACTPWTKQVDRTLLYLAGKMYTLTIIKHNCISTDLTWFAFSFQDHSYFKSLIGDMMNFMVLTTWSYRFFQWLASKKRSKS